MVAVGSGLALGLAFPPFDLDLLAFVAIAALLWTWRDARPRDAALTGLVFGIAFYGVLLEWSRYFGVVAVVPLVVAVAAYAAATGALVAALASRGLRSPWLTAATWVLLEGLRDRWPLGGFPWGEVGVVLHDLPAARALASWGGVPLVSFLLVAANALLLDALLALRARRVRPLALSAAGLVVVVAATAGASALRFDPTATGRLRFALLQGNDQNRDLTDAEVASGYLTRRHLALARSLRGRYDLVVFPESALDSDPERDPALRAALVDLARRHHAVVLANARAAAPDGGLYNANLAYTAAGRLQGVYAKQHLVPFGEYVPWRSRLGFIRELQQVPYDYERGRQRVLFRARGHPIGSVICFESAFAHLTRAYVRDGAQLLVVTTNNRSYRRSGLSEQHVALSQLRAAETGRAVLHASVSGITAVIEPDGSVRDTSRLFVNRVTTGRIPTTTGSTPFVRYGDWVLALSALVVLGAAATGEWRRRRARPAVAAGGGPTTAPAEGGEPRAGRRIAGSIPEGAR